MTKALIADGIAGPVTAMALQRVGIEAVVYGPTVPPPTTPAPTSPSPPTAWTPCRHRRRPAGAGGRLPHPDQRAAEQLRPAAGGGQQRLGGWPTRTVSRTIRQARLYRACAEAAACGITLEDGRRLVGAGVTAAGGVVATFDDGTQATEGPAGRGGRGPSVTRRLLDPAAPGPRYVGLVNFGGYTPAPRTAASRAHGT